MRDEAVAERVNILLVDDRPGNLLSLSGVLDNPEYNLVLASSGPEALKHILHKEFAVVLLDVAMPEMDGFEVATLMKQRARTKTIPIIFVTASVQHLDWIFRAYKIGAVDFLPKPVDPDAVRAKVAVFVELYRSRRQVERQVELLQESERRERELELTNLRLETERRVRNLADAIPHVVWTADRNGHIDSFNRRWEYETGVPGEAALGDAWRTVIHPEDRPRFEARWQEGLTAGAEFDEELRLRRADQSYRWFNCHALPEVDGEGAIVRWLGTLTDVDERRRAHDAMRAAVEMRDEFLSIASHELRTPLTSLQLHLQVLQRRVDQLPANVCDERLAPKVRAAVRQTERLATLVDGLLDVTRIRAGRLELKVEEFDAVALLREVVERFREEGARAGCDLRLHAPDSATVRWDRVRVEQVLTNLLSNSLKYAAGEPVDITLADSPAEVRVTVRDRGIGIDADGINRIFERFERAVTGHHYGGLGLGLYIVRQIVDAHGGTVEVTSQPGEGATFHVTMPRYVEPVAGSEEREPVAEADEEEEKDEAGENSTRH